MSGALASLTDWAVALGVVGGLAFLLARLRLGSRRGVPLKQPVAPPPQPVLEPQRSREQLASAAHYRPSLAAIQAQAAFQIDAAEHAFNRLLAECASVMRLPVAPTFETMHALLQQPAPPAARPSLAA